MCSNYSLHIQNLVQATVDWTIYEKCTLSIYIILEGGSKKTITALEDVKIEGINKIQEKKTIYTC